MVYTGLISSFSGSSLSVCFEAEKDCGTHFFLGRGAEGGVPDPRVPLVDIWGNLSLCTV
jgi:hypothetical protein